MSDIINPTPENADINISLTLASGDNNLVNIPNLNIGYVKRLAVSNPTAATRTLTIKDNYTPDITNGNTSPSAVSRQRYQMTIPTNDFVEISQGKIAKIIGQLDLNSDAAGLVVSALMELE